MWRAIRIYNLIQFVYNLYTDCIQNDNTLETQIRLDKIRLDKNRLDTSSADADSDQLFYYKKLKKFKICSFCSFCVCYNIK